ncbi:hypothetical protein E4U23_007728 [Claviceps purpurea]|nr:hypothetical protein E4U23_007728 [Claviceps purpurea]
MATGKRRTWRGQGFLDDWNYASIFKRQVRLQGPPFLGFGKNREELIQMVREKIPKELLEFGGWIQQTGDTNYRRDDQDSIHRTTDRESIRL